MPDFDMKIWFQNIKTAGAYCEKLEIASATQRQHAIQHLKLWGQQMIDFAEALEKESE